MLPPWPWPLSSIMGCPMPDTCPQCSAETIDDNRRISGSRRCANCDYRCELEFHFGGECFLNEYKGDKLIRRDYVDEVAPWWK